MIFIVVKFPVRPERSAEWLDAVAGFTAAVRAEEGNVFFEWSRSVEEPDTFVLVEGFASAQAGEEHVRSPHFQQAIKDMSGLVSATPSIISVPIEATGWSEMGEVSPVGEKASEKTS